MPSRRPRVPGRSDERPVSAGGERPIPGGERRLATDEEARALASSLRLRIMRICLGEPHTNREIADVVGLNPATTLHHVRRLVHTGFLVAQDVRRGARGAREIPYLATGKSWKLETPARDRVLLDTFLEELAQISHQDLQTARLGMRLPPQRWEQFQTRLRELLDEYAFAESDPNAQAWSLFLAIHPDPNRP